MTRALISPGAGRRSIPKDLTSKTCVLVLWEASWHNASGGDLTDRMACHGRAVGEPVTGFSVCRQASEIPCELFDELREELINC